jgi:hypothetical protein
MKSVFCLICVAALATTVGCIFPGHRDDGDRRHEEHRDHDEYRERSDYQTYPQPGFDVAPERLEATRGIA